LNILALDQATKCGWAAYYREEVYFGVQDLTPKRGESAGMRYLRFGGWLHEMNDIIGGIKLIVHEQPHHRGGSAAQVAIGLVTKILEFSAKNGCEVLPVHGSRLKKWLTGKGNASKAEMIAEIKKRGYAVKDDDEADAVALLLYAAEKFGLGLK
jgi:hypothetical protein